MESKLTLLAKERSSSEMKVMSKQSLDWLAQKIAQLKGTASIPIGMSRERFRQVNDFRLGKLYCFYYDPKGKEDLPYYDRFPMVLAIEKYNDGFLGLNLHYLPFNYRMAFLGKLLKFAVQGEPGEIDRLRVTYDILVASRRLKEFRPCIKRYLSGHIQSKILAIQPNEWDIAAFLPLQQFRGAKSQQVWQESLEQIRN
jgi:hypothetical protein